MRRIFYKLFIKLHTFFYQLTGGRLGGQLGEYPILLLTTTGRKSGAQFTTPLSYFNHEDGYVIIASNGGNPQHPQWYFNLKKDPQVKVQINDQILPVQAEILDEKTRTPIWKRIISKAPQYQAYQERTERLIPVVWLRG